MAYVLIAVGVLIILGIALMLLARQPYHHKNVRIEDIGSFLGVLLKRGYHGGFVIITDMKSDRFIQFAKYIKGKGNIGLELSFPKAPWSEQYYKRLEDFLRTQEIPFAIQPVASQAVKEFLGVDCRSDLDLAFRLVKGIVHDVFELRVNPLFRISFSNVSARDELIDAVKEEHVS